ncbi:hypothetical protein QOT17_007719 [Balamuthia mandrillaris]
MWALDSGAWRRRMAELLDSPFGTWLGGPSPLSLRGRRERPAPAATAERARKRRRHAEEEGNRQEGETASEAEEEAKGKEVSPSALWSGSGWWLPHMDIVEKEEVVRLLVELPGIRKEDINLEIDPTTNTLHISGEKWIPALAPSASAAGKEKEGAEEEEVEEAGESVTLRERRFGMFKRSVSFPFELEHAAVDARLEDGVLRIDVPKRSKDKGKELEKHFSVHVREAEEEPVLPTERKTREELKEEGEEEEEEEDVEKEEQPSPTKLGTHGRKRKADTTTIATITEPPKKSERLAKRKTAKKPEKEEEEETGTQKRGRGRTSPRGTTKKGAAASTTTGRGGTAKSKKK